MTTSWQSENQFTGVLSDNEHHWLFKVKRLSKTLAESVKNIYLSKYKHKRFVAAY